MYVDLVLGGQLRSERRCIGRLVAGRGIVIPRSRALSALSAARTLGWGAPVRAGYEVSKRCGGHRVVFGSLAKRQLSTGTAVSPFLAPLDATLPASVQARCLAEAGEICAGNLRVFGRVIAEGEIPDWHSVIDAPGRWPLIPWWKIDLRSSERPGDVKWAWELGRHRHLVVLARAALLQPAENRWRDTLSSHIRSWIAANPPEMGVHWYSNLEIALRSLSWLQVLALAGSQLEPSLVAGMSRTLYHSGRHMVTDLPYTLSSMRNNHLLGDGLGLIAIGRSFPDDPRARRWLRIGDRLFRSQLQRHMRPDGSMIEDSLSYHRFVVEMLTVRVLVDAPATLERAALKRAAQFLCRMGVLEGKVPMYGDWDEGRVLASSGDAAGVAGSALLALSLVGTGSRDDWRGDHDEVAWYSLPGSPDEPAKAESEGRNAGDGFARAARGPFTCWLKAGSGPSHGHADLCSTVIAIENEWVVGDPGTGSYNRTSAERDYFRSSIAHSVLRLSGQDELVPLSSFRWRHTARGFIGRPFGLDEQVLAWGFHDAYRRLEPSRRVCRAVLCSRYGVSVVDWVEGAPGCAYELSLPLAPGVVWQEGIMTVPGCRHTLFTELPGKVRLIHGRSGSPEGYWSSTYGQLDEAHLIVASGVVDGPIIWQLSVTGQHALRVDRDAIVMADGTRATVEWTQAHPKLRLESGP
jgi:hypothetical protein